MCGFRQRRRFKLMSSTEGVAFAKRQISDVFSGMCGFRQRQLSGVLLSEDRVDTSTFLADGLKGTCRFR